MDKTMIRTYTELCEIPIFYARYLYLQLRGRVGVETFGNERYLNQIFYTSREWRAVRDKVIARDRGCDLGMDGYEIQGKIYVHHMTPVTLEDILYDRDWILNPEYLISVSERTHNAIHYGESYLLPEDPIERRPNDTCLWKQEGTEIGRNEWEHPYRDQKSSGSH